jgi:membrane protease YdiL (CAAX protease family)
VKTNLSFLELSNRGKNGALRWWLGIVIVLFFWLIVGSLLAIPFLVFSGALLTGSLEGSDPFWIYLGTNVSFLGIWLGLWLAVRVIHQRAFLTLVTPAPKINWRRLAEGFGVWFALIALFQILEFVIYPSRAQFTFAAARWLRFLPFILILTPLQTSAEELLFRGYFLQGSGRLTQNVTVLIVLNGILFAAPHMLNPEVLNNAGSAQLLFLNYFLIGAAFAFYTLRDNRLELVLGAHAANNLFGALLVNYSDSALTTPAVFTNPTLDATFGLVTLIISTFLFYLIVFHVRQFSISAQQ